MTDIATIAEETPDDDQVVDEATLGQYEFIDRLPTPEEVVALLSLLPPVWGVEYKEFAAYVVPLPSYKKVKVSREQNGRTMAVEEGHNVVTLYFGVAGRLKMMQAAAEANCWRVDFVPEPNTPHGPGFLEPIDSERMVYREYVQIAVIGSDGTEVNLGSKPGMAWVPRTGGRQAAGSNPYEKVETSARGRALAAWGFGVIPGSGVASLEEMQATKTNRMMLQANRTAAVMTSTGRKSREDLTGELLTLLEEVRQLRKDTSEQMNDKMIEYAKRAFDLDVAVIDGDVVKEIDWSKLKDGQVQLTINQLRDTKAKLVGVGEDD